MKQDSYSASVSTCIVALYDCIAKFDNIGTDLLVIKSRFMNEVYELKNKFEL